MPASGAAILVEREWEHPNGSVKEARPGDVVVSRIVDSGLVYRRP